MISANRRIPAIAGAAVLLIVVAWYLLLWSPESKSIQSAHKAHAAADQKITDLQSQITQLQGLVKQIPQDQAKFAQLESELPDNPQLDQALNLLHQAAVQSGVTLGSFAPSAASPSSSGSQAAAGQGGGGAPAITLSLSVQGTLTQVKAFLSALDTLPRTVVVDKVSLNTGTTSAAAITARIFYAGQPSP